jgi:NADPH:quinone reductase-like Zn-dependent oxidoreductase
MRQIWITKPGPPEVLQVREAPDPEVAADQIRIRVRASGINFADLMARLGLYPDAPKIPCVVGYEVSGLVDQVGTGVTGFKEGDRVFAMPRFGGYSDMVVVPAGQVLHMPAAMSFEEAAALPVVYLTAHHLLLYTGSLHPGMRVLVHSAAGGVGLAAIELLRAHDCVIIGTASPGKHDFLRARGVQHCIDSNGDVVAAVRALLGPGEFVDIVLDPVGGRSWKESYALVGPAGRVACYGVSVNAPGKRRNLWAVAKMAASIPLWNPISMMNGNKSVTGVNMGHLFDQLRILRPQLDALVRLFDQGTIRPFVDRTFTFEEAAQAHHYLHDRKARGKLLLVP